MYQKEFLKIIYTALPDEISDVIASEETLNSLLKIEDDYKLSKEQRDSVLLETTIRIIGLTSKTKFQEKLEKELKINAVIAGKIANDIATVILSRIPEKILANQEEYAQAKLKEWQSKPQTQPIIETSDLESLSPTKTTELEVPPANLPMVEPGEIVHDSKPFVPPIQTSVQNQQPKPNIPTTPQTGYPGGKDPYREPLE